jgi:hypothetical protein
MERHKGIVLSIEDEFSDFHADFLSSRRCEPSILRLLREQPGRWWSVEDLLPETDHMRQRLLELQERAGGDKLFISWLHYPPTSDDYVLIIFFVAQMNWDAVAIYNKARLISASESKHAVE